MKTLLALLVVATGCSDQCVDGESICDATGTKPLQCGPPNDVTDTRGFNEISVECGAGATCKDLMDGALRVAVCTTSGAPDPRCTSEGLICADAHTGLACQLGYSEESDCAGACVNDTAKSVLFCSVEDAPNPICDAHDPVVCDQNTVASCFDHYVIDRLACADSCVASANGVGYCAIGAACGTPDEATCDGLHALHGCISGHVVDMTCNPESECENYLVVATGATQAQCVHRDP